MFIHSLYQEHLFLDYFQEKIIEQKKNNKHKLETIVLSELSDLFYLNTSNFLWILRKEQNQTVN